MPQVPANDGARPFCGEAGGGRPFVLIRGWSFSGRFFARNVPALAERASSCPTCAATAGPTSQATAAA